MNCYLFLLLIKSFTIKNYQRTGRFKVDVVSADFRSHRRKFKFYSEATERRYLVQ